MLKQIAIGLAITVVGVFAGVFLYDKYKDHKAAAAAKAAANGGKTN